MQIFVRYWHVLCRFVEYMCHCLTKVCSAVYEYLNGRDVKLPFSNEPRYCNWIHGEMTGAHFGLRPYFSTPFHGFSPYLIRPRLFPNEFWIFASIHSLSLSLDFRHGWPTFSISTFSFVSSVLYWSHPLSLSVCHLTACSAFGRPRCHVMFHPDHYAHFCCCVILLSFFF